MDLKQTPSNPGFWKNSYCYIKEYCSHTSIHGLQYLGEKKRCILERLCWLVVLTVSLYFCLNSIIHAYEKWNTSPIVVSFATSETPIWKIPFPAVTICPQVKTLKNVVNFTSLTLMYLKGQQLNDEQAKQLDYMSLICSIEDEGYYKQHEEFLSEDIIDFYMKVNPQLHYMTERFFWKRKNYTAKVNTMFTPLLTNEGICFSFNLLDRDDLFKESLSIKYYDTFSIPHQPTSKWSLEKGYENLSDLDSLPRRTALAGTDGGLELILWVDTLDLDYICGNAIQGYKVILHNPTQIPYVRQGYFRVGLNQDVTAAIKPNIIKTSKQVKDYNQLQRKCYFMDEKQLRFFKSYDQKNCLHECLSNVTFDQCDCVAFFMQRDDSTPICGLGKQACIERAMALFTSKELFFRINIYNGTQLKSNTSKEFQGNCDCLPNCDSLTYEVETSQTEWRWHERAKLLDIYKHESQGKYEYSRLTVFFKDMQFISSERNELYGEMDFLASCGGLLGLFIGFSIISCIEIIYFLTVRFFCNLYIHGWNYWSGADELTDLKENH